MDTVTSKASAEAPEDDPYVGEYSGVCGGYPVIRNTRIAVRHVVWLHENLSVDEIVDEWYSHLTREQIQGALDYYAKFPARVDEDIERNKRAYAEAHGLPWPA